MRALVLALLLTAGAAAQPCPTPREAGAPVVVPDGDACLAVLAFEASAGDAVVASWQEPEGAGLDAGGAAVADARVLAAELRSADGAFRLALSLRGWDELPLRMPTAGPFEVRVRVTPGSRSLGLRVETRTEGPAESLFVPTLPRARDVGPLVASTSVHVEAGQAQPFTVWGLRRFGSVPVTVTGPLGPVEVQTASTGERWIEATATGRYRVDVSLDRDLAVQHGLDAGLDPYTPQPVARYRAEQADAEQADAETIEDIELVLEDVPPPPRPPGRRGDGG